MTAEANVLPPPKSNSLPAGRIRQPGTETFPRDRYKRNRALSQAAAAAAAAKTWLFNKGTSRGYCIPTTTANRPRFLVSEPVYCTGLRPGPGGGLGGCLGLEPGRCLKAAAAAAAESSPAHRLASAPAGHLFPEPAAFASWAAVDPRDLQPGARLFTACPWSPTARHRRDDSDSPSTGPGTRAEVAASVSDPTDGPFPCYKLI